MNGHGKLAATILVSLLGLLGAIPAERRSGRISCSCLPTIWAMATSAASVRRKSARRTRPAGREGMRLTQHYSGNAVCAPSRCVLMTGMHPGHAFVRNNRSKPPKASIPIPGRDRHAAEAAAEQRLRDRRFGKWGLGGDDTTGEPMKQGIDRFFGYYCQGVAHNYYPHVPVGQRHEAAARQRSRSPRIKSCPPGPIRTTRQPTTATRQAIRPGPDRRRGAEIRARRTRTSRSSSTFPRPFRTSRCKCRRMRWREYKDAFPEDPPYAGGKGTCRIARRGPRMPRWSRGWIATSAGSSI